VGKAIRKYSLIGGQSREKCSWKFHSYCSFSVEMSYRRVGTEKQHFRKELTPNLTGSAGSNSGFHTLIHDPCITHKTLIGHDVVTGIIIDEISLLRAHGPAGSHRGSRRSCTAGAVILFGMSDQTLCVHP